MAAPKRFSPGAMLRGRCPRCGEGAIFPPLLSRRALAMYSHCPVCGLDYEPEPGYFLGAMYVSYTMGILTILPVALALILVAGAALAVTMLVALAQALVTMMFMYRASRVVWLHLDQVLDPR
jgi:uncharacterized protein (DUF983 family)